MSRENRFYGSATQVLEQFDGKAGEFMHVDQIRLELINHRKESLAIGFGGKDLRQGTDRTMPILTVGELAG